jgi:hypothetical protein
MNSSAIAMVFLLLAMIAFASYVLCGKVRVALTDPVNYK